MIDNLFDHVGFAETHEDLIRNIVSIRVSQDLFDDLSDNPQDWQAAIQLEMSTSPFATSPQTVIDRPFEEAQWNDAIDYPFRHWMRSRYSDGSFGVWYGGDTIEATVCETIHHWHRQFLSDAGFLQAGIRGERKLFRVRCDAALIDFRSAIAAFPGIIDPIDYTLTHQIGARLHREGHPGVLSLSARGEGCVYAVLNQKVLTDPRQICFLTYITTENGVSIEREPGVTWFEING